MNYVERRVPRAGHNLYVRDYPGSNPAFVLMHGFPDNMQIYDGLAPILAGRGHRVVAFDFLGYGQSDKPSDYGYSAENLEGDLKAVLDTLSIEQAIPVGHDASGPTAINWSLNNEERVSRLVLLNTYYDAAPTLRFPELICLFADPHYRDLSAAIIADPEQFSWVLRFQNKQFARNVPPAIRERTQDALVQAIRGQFRASRSAAIAFVRLTRELHSVVASNTRRVNDLKHFGKAVKLVWGAGDPYLSLGVGEHLRGHFGNAQLTALRLGHWPQIDNPQDVAQSILS